MIDGYPLHRLNTAQARSWLLIPGVRRQTAEWLAKNYKTGCVVLSPALRAFCMVSPRGQITALQWPYRRFEFWQISNKPSLRYNECACRDFYDLESGERWGNRDKERNADIHHSFCQGRQVASLTWEHAYKSAMHRIAEKQPPQERPDEWIKTAEKIEG